MSGSELTDASQRRNLDEIEVNLMLMTSCGNIPGVYPGQIAQIANDFAAETCLLCRNVDKPDIQG